MVICCFLLKCSVSRWFSFQFVAGDVFKEDSQLCLTIRGMDKELQRQSSMLGTGHLGDQESLRLRQVSYAVSNQTYPQNNQRGTPAEEGDAGNNGPPMELRNFPYPMKLKRAVRQVQQMQVPILSSAESWKRKKTKFLQKLKKNTLEFFHLFSLWGKTLQKIGGNFGGGVQSYFLFLRFLVVLNFVSFLLLAGFVIIPSIVFRYVGISSANSTELHCFPTEEQCMEYEPNPQGLVVFFDLILDILSGTGFMEYSFMFYGYYNNTLVEDENFSYNVPIAYLFTAIFYFAFCLICVIKRMGTAARVAVATGGSTVGNYSMIVFTGWDYGCLGDRATKLKQKSILYRLQVDLEEESRKKQAAALTTWQKVVLYTSRVLMFFLALGLIAAAFYGIFVATTFSQTKSEEQGFLGLFFEYLPSIVITTGNFVVPLLCDQIALVERYTPSNTVILALLRAVFLRLVSLGVLLYTLWSQITCDGNVQSANCVLCQYNHDNYPCWETRVGQEMYKLTLFDLLTNIAMLVLVEFPRRMVVDNTSCKLSQWVGRQEFVVPSNVLGVVYSQTVVWAGALFCPLLPLINTIKFIIIFYCKKITLFSNCRPALRTFRSTTSTFFFLVVLFFGWILALVVMIYAVAVIKPSPGCGPFRLSCDMWSIVPASFYTLSKTAQEFLFFIGSQAFSIPLFVVSCVVMCYFVALSSVYGKSVALLRAQLKLVGQDKQFLVKQIALSQQLQMPEHNT
ncbi:voltage-gated chloride channel TMC4 [Menidia menidia]